jgi:adenylate cyclase
MEDFLNEINQDIKDIFRYDIETSKTYLVPTRNDASLTFPIGTHKKGKLLETCVLMVDIRNSTKISKLLKNDIVKLGKIYSSFIYAMTNIADEYGYVRNIVGDRVMVVFEPNNCFADAINCAAVMYTVARKILLPHAGLEEFKIGIGVDYGEMLVLKTGIQKRYHEQSEHKGLVWVGDVANTASKLCDFANKEYSSPVFKVTYEKVTLDIFNSFKTTSTLISVDLDYINFAKNIIVGPEGMKYDGSKVSGFNIEKRAGITSPILISGKVVTEFKKLVPESIFLSKLTKVEYPNKPFTGSGIFGGAFLVPEISKIKI